MLVRAMVLTEFRCPPLPVIGQRLSMGNEVVINSHDLMAAFMTQSFKLADESKNSTRRQMQQDSRERYLRDLTNEATKPFERIYEIMSRHTCEYLGSYLLGTQFSASDIRILPPDHVTPRLAEEIDHYGRALNIMITQGREAVSSPTVVDYSCHNVVQSLLMRCARCAVEYKEEGVVHEPVLKRMRNSIAAE